jgi:hypothetical protein
MSCLICGDENTVKSHILPKAFAHLIKDGAPHAITASRHYRGAKPSQGGPFSNEILCRNHEAMTAAADKYAVEFVRRINDAWDHKSTRLLRIENPQPHFLREFAILTIWREVHSGHAPGLTLGPYEEPVRSLIFDGGPALEWPVVVQRTNFLLTETRAAVDFNLHPYRIKFAGRNGWLLTVAGIGFFVISDRRGLASPFEEFRADVLNPVPITVADPMPFTDVGALKYILRNMASPADRRRRS